MSKWLAVISLLAVMGCSDSTSPSSYTAGENWGSIICIDNVEYIRGAYLMTPHMKVDGSVHTCGYDD